MPRFSRLFRRKVRKAWKPAGKSISAALKAILKLKPNDMFGAIFGMLVQLFVFAVKLTYYTVVELWP